MFFSFKCFQLPQPLYNNLYLTLGENSEQVSALSCLANGSKPLSYLWEVYQSSNDSWTKPSVRAVNITSPTLGFSKLTEEDEGIYRCVVFSDDDNATSDNATITLYGELQYLTSHISKFSYLPIGCCLISYCLGSLCSMCLGPAKITYISPDMTYLEGTKVRLVCNVTNDADAINQVQIAWFYKNSSSYQVASSNNHEIHHVENSTTGQSYSILHFNSVNRTDEGVYICRASNDPQSRTESTTESSTEVKIKSK